MQPEGPDVALLWNMRVQAQGLAQLARRVTFDEFLENEDLQLAAERRIEIIGEAAGHVSEAFKESLPDIPWRSIIGQRNLIVHGYATVDPERI